MVGNSNNINISSCASVDKRWVTGSESIVVGDYEAKVTAIGINDEGDDSLFTFSVDLPEIPTIKLNTTSLSVEVFPSVITWRSIFTSLVL